MDNITWTLNVLSGLTGTAGSYVFDAKGRVRVTLRVPESGALPESARQRARAARSFRCFAHRRRYP